MRLALNTFVYEVARTPILDTLKSAARLGFRFIEYAAYQAGDPTLLDERGRRGVARVGREEGLQSAQMLLVNTQDLASPDVPARQRALEYMKRCTDFHLEMGGRQVLICRGGGLHQPDMTRTEAWMNSISTLRRFAEWGADKGVLVDLEVEPHVYFVTNSTQKMVRAIEDIGMPNVLANIDIGHLSITREGPRMLDKLKPWLVQVHLSETDTFAHTNSILGTGVADFPPYVERLRTLGIEENCNRLGEPCVAGIEMGNRGGTVDDPERWVRESLAYLSRVLPDLKP